MADSIGAIIRKAEKDYISGTTHISKYVEFSQYENIEKIDAYLNSKHVSGSVDSMGREKPFFNIVTGAVNIWFRATDIDRKNIRVKATKQQDFIGAFLATIHLQQWMKNDAFGVFLNDWGRSLARYGSSVCKFVQKKDGLHSSVIPWNRMISDTVDFESNPQIEKLFLTPSQLKKNKAYNQDVVKSLLTALSTRKTADNQRQDNKSDYIEVYEIHGELSKELLTENEKDCDEYVQQMQVVSMVEKADKKGEYDEFVLLKGKEAKSPYMLTHLIREDGRAQSIGAVEHLFESQWMSNHSVKSIKDQLDLASKLIFQTSDGNFAGVNTLNAIETGDILIHADNAPITQVQNNSHDIASLQSFGQQWQALAKEITSTPDAISGNTMPSGTAYRQVAILNQESHSLFEIMTENKGLAIEEMMRKFILPYIMTLMDTTDEISATLTAHDIKKIDSMYVRNEAIRRHNAKVTFEAMNDLPIQGLDIDAESQDIQADLEKNGDQRFIVPSEISTVTWREILKDLVWDVEVEVTNEQSDKEAIMTTLTTLFQTIADPIKAQVMQTPAGKFLFNKIIETTGAVSAVELAQNPAPTQPTPQNPQSVGGGQQAGGVTLPSDATGQVPAMA